MDPDVTPPSQKTKASLENFLTPVKNIASAFKNLATPFKSIATALKNLSIPFKNIPTALKHLSTPFKKLPIPKKLLIPAIAGAVLLTVGGAAFGLLHAKPKHTVASQPKAVSASPVASTAKPSKACSGVVRDIYRQTVEEDPSVTLADVRAEVLKSGVTCAPVPEIAAGLNDLSPACRDMVQYTFLGVRDGNPDIKLNDVREKVVEKSVACEHDRRPNIASAARHKAK